MPNLYGNSNASSGLYGSATDSLLSPRNAEAAKQLGLPEAVGGHGAAGGQIEANDPYANFEDIFNTNRAKGKEMAGAETAKVQETATGEKPQMADGFDQPGQAMSGPATPGTVQATQAQNKLSPSSVSGQIAAAPTLQAKQATADQTAISRQPLLAGFGEESGPQQYGGSSGATQLGQGTEQAAVRQDALDSDVAPPPARKIYDANGVETDNQGNPVDPFGADKTDTTQPYVNPQALAPEHIPTRVEQGQIDRGEREDPSKPKTNEMRDARNLRASNRQFEVPEVGFKDEELAKLDRLTKANDMLKGYADDNGQGLLSDIYGNATQYDAALAGAAGGRDQMAQVQAEYGGADERYAKELVGTELGRRHDAMATNEANTTNTNIRNAELAAKNQPAAVKPGGFMPEGYTDMNDFLQGDGSTGDAYEQAHSASQKISPADWLTRALGEAGVDTPMASEMFGKMFGGSASPEQHWQEANIRTSLEEIRVAYGNEAAQWLWDNMNPEMWAYWMSLSNPGSISRELRKLLEQGGFSAGGKK